MVTRVLTIAGSDSGGGAGIQADLKTVGALGGHGMSAITALTAQNTVGVSGVHPVPVEFVRLQIETVVDDIGVDSIKTGMLPSADIVTEVAATLAGLGSTPIVVDPVLTAESGAVLVEGSAERALLEQLIPRATLATPNAVEAGRLVEMKIESVADQRTAARRLVERGARAVLVKGGHLPGEVATDVLLVDGKIHELTGPWLDAENTHGTGCMLASAIAYHLGTGEDLVTSATLGKAFVSGAIAAGLAIGAGPGPANPFWKTKL